MLGEPERSESVRTSIEVEEELLRGGSDVDLNRVGVEVIDKHLGELVHVIAGGTDANAVVLCAVLPHGHDEAASLLVEMLLVRIRLAHEAEQHAQRGRENDPGPPSGNETRLVSVDVQCGGAHRGRPGD